MKQFFLIISLFFTLSFLLSCKEKVYHYPQDRKISNEQGILNDSLGVYFSTFEPFDSSQSGIVENDFRQQYLSATLYAFKEPVLYNDYLKKDEYRFLWLRSFDLPMVFTIADEDGNITLTTKKLDRVPIFRDRKFMADDPEQRDSDFIARGYTVIKEKDTFKNGHVADVIVVKADRRAVIIYDSTINLSRANWRKFETLISEAKYWDLKPYEWEGASDGSSWVIEGHKKSGYKFLVRQSGGGGIRKIGEMLIGLSGLKEEIY